MSRDLERERARITARSLKEILTESERAELSALLPRLEDELRDGTIASIAAREYRVPSASAAHLGDRLNAALAVLGTLRRRARRLEALARDPWSERTTNGIRVRVQSSLQPAHTAPAVDRYVYAYDVEIENASCEEDVQVVSRRWRVVDEDGNEEVVEGNGVVGEQPTLKLGEKFTYTSACVIKRTRGAMSGAYVCVGQRSQRVFEVDIAPFALTPPRGRRRVRDDDDDEEDDDIAALVKDSANERASP